MSLTLENSPSNITIDQTPDQSKAQSGLAQFGKEFVAGTMGGIAQVISGHPFDTVKVRLQTQSSVNPQFAGVGDCFRQTIQKEGFVGLYKGVTSPLLGIGIANAAIFSANGYFRRLLNPNPSAIPNERLSLLNTSIAGGLTGVVVSFVNTPVELLKIRFQVETGAKSRYTGLLDCGKQIVAQSGVRGLYQGYLTTLTREIPAYAGYFFAYFSLRNLYLNDFQSISPETIDLKREIPTWYLLISGGVAGLACWLSSYPQDVIKSRIQMSTAPVTPTIKQTISTIMKESSYRGFFRGLSPALLRAFPANAATFVVYEYSMSLMN